MTGLDEIGENHRFVVEDHRPERDRKHQILAPAPMSEIPLAVGAVSGPVMWLALITEESSNAGVGLDDDVTAGAAIATLRLALGSPLGP